MTSILIDIPNKFLILFRETGIVRILMNSNIQFQTTNTFLDFITNLAFMVKHCIVIGLLRTVCIDVCDAWPDLDNKILSQSGHWCTHRRRDSESLPSPGDSKKSNFRSLRQTQDKRNNFLPSENSPCIHTMIISK